MRRSLGILSLFVGIGLLASVRGEDGTSDELKQLQGTWTLVSMEIKGNAIPVEKMPGRIAFIEGTTFSDRNETKIFGKGTIKLNASKTPKTIDAEFTEGPPKGKTALAIFELKGDTLKACAAEPGEARPTKFTTKEGTGHMLVTYKKKQASP